jgi:hypothetical protein
MPDRKRVRIEVKIIDTDPGAPLERMVLGSASREMDLPTNLLQGSGAFVTGAQNHYSDTVAAIGTAAYREAFPRAQEG